MALTHWVLCGRSCRCQGPRLVEAWILPHLHRIAVKGIKLIAHSLRLESWRVPGSLARSVDLPFLAEDIEARLVPLSLRSPDFFPHLRLVSNDITFVLLLLNDCCFAH